MDISTTESEVPADLNNESTAYLTDNNNICNHGNNDYDVKTPRKPRAPTFEFDVTEEMENRFGWWCLKPDFCQRFRTPKWILFVLSIAFILQSFSSNGLLPSCISSLERQFNLSSTEIGMIISAFDVALVSLVVPVTYFGGKGNKPLWLGAGFLIFGLGALVFALPHFASDVYRPLSHAEDNLLQLCSGNVTCEDQSERGGSGYFYVFIIAQVLQGIGSAPMFALGVPYLDESLDPKTSPIYVGILMSMSLVGTALGFGGGGQLLNLYTDFDRMETSLLKTKPGHTSWVGAWWPGFILCGILALIDGLLVMGFPAQMPGSIRFRHERNTQLHQHAISTNLSDVQTPEHPWQTTLHHFRTILTNPMFMCLVLMSGMEGFIVTGYGSFLAKYIQYEFKLTTAFSGIYTGICLVVGGGVGVVLGGYLVTKLNLTCRRAVKFMIIMTFFWFPPLFGFLHHCPRQRIAGVTIPYYHDDTFNHIQNISVISACNVNCNCPTEYSPVCDVTTRREYFSACHAGCTNQNLSNCACAGVTSESQSNVTLSPGRCDSDCTVFLPLFLLMVGGVVVFSFISVTPAITAAMRSIPERLRPLGLGIMQFVGRLIGSIPSPITFGAMIDQSCDVWEVVNFCGGSTKRGSCQIYDLSKTGLYMLLGGCIPKLIGLVFLVLAGTLYKPPPMHIMVTSVDLIATPVTLNTISTDGESLDTPIDQSKHDINRNDEVLNT